MVVRHGDCDYEEQEEEEEEEVSAALTGACSGAAAAALAAAATVGFKLVLVGGAAAAAAAVTAVMDDDGNSGSGFGEGDHRGRDRSAGALGRGPAEVRRRVLGELGSSGAPEWGSENPLFSIPLSSPCRPSDFVGYFCFALELGAFHKS